MKKLAITLSIFSGILFVIAVVSHVIGSVADRDLPSGGVDIGLAILLAAALINIPTVVVWFIHRTKNREPNIEVPTRKVKLPMKPVSICLLAGLLSGCGLSIRTQSKPASEDLSGTYRYVGLGSFSPDQFPNPLIEFENIAGPCDVKVSHEGRRFEVGYKDKSGSPVRRIVDLNKKPKGISWKNRELLTTKRVPIEGPIILPLPGMHYRGTRLFRNGEGNLVVVGFFEEKGPFWTDYSEDEIILERKND